MEIFDKSTCKLVKEELVAASKAIAEKYGITVTFGGGSYDSASFSPKVKFIIPAAAVEKASKDAALYGPSLGLPVDVIGKTFRQRTKTFTVTGLNLSRPKNAVELRDENGKPFKCSVELLKTYLSAAA